MKKVLIAILLLGLLPHASADYIHRVDFRLSAPVLRSALGAGHGLAGRGAAP